MAGAALASAALFAATSPQAAGAAGRVIEERRLDERLVELTPRSPALGRTIPVALLTPRGWDRRRPDDRWPTLCLLAGKHGDHTMSTGVFRVQDPPESRDVLVDVPAMPVFGLRTGRWHHSAGGPPRTRAYSLCEVVPLVERRCGAGPRRRRPASRGAASGPWGSPPGFPACSAPWPPSAPPRTRSSTRRYGSRVRPSSASRTRTRSSATPGTNGGSGWTGTRTTGPTAYGTRRSTSAPTTAGAHPPRHALRRLRPPRFAARVAPVARGAARLRRAARLPRPWRARQRYVRATHPHQCGPTRPKRAAGQRFDAQDSVGRSSADRRPSREGQRPSSRGEHRGVGTEGHIGAGRSRARAADARTSSTENE